MKACRILQAFFYEKFYQNRNRPTALPDEAEILIAELSENDFYAFEQNENVLVAYIKEEDFNEETLRSILPKMRHIHIQ